MKKLLRKLTAVVSAAVVALAGVNFGGIGGLTVAAAETTDAFTVTGGTLGTDYTYADGVLTIKTSTPITIANADPSAATTDRIEVADGVSANITLAGVNIDVSSSSSTASFTAGADITINDTAYPTNHNGEKKIYAYLPAKSVSEPNVVKVGTEERKYIYYNLKWLIVPTVTAPTPNELVYTGEEQALVTKGMTSGGTIVYSLSEDDEYTTAIPTGTEAKNYTVWYKVEGSEDYADTLPASVEVTIKALPVIKNADTIKNQSIVFGTGDFVAPLADVMGTVTYKPGQTTYTAETLKVYLAGKNVGDSPVAVDYTFKPTDTTNYKDQKIKEVTGTISFTIEKAESSVGTAPKAKEKLTYDGTAQALVDEGTAVGGTMIYSTSRDETDAIGENGFRKGNYL